MRSSRHSSKLPLFAFAWLFAVPSSIRADVIAGWETTGQYGWGIQGLAPTVSNSHVTLGGLTRGSGVSTPGNGPGNVWGGKNWNTRPLLESEDFDLAISEAIAAGDYFTFSVTPQAGFDVSFDTFTLNYQRSATGPAFATFQYKIGNGSFSDVEPFELPVSAPGGSAIAPINIASATGEALQGVSAEITFRVIPYGATDPDGTFLVNGSAAGTDLTLEGDVGGSGPGDLSPPLVNGLTPADNATNVTEAEATLLTVVFNEPVARGTGQILVKSAATGDTINTLNVTNPAHVTLAGNQIGLIMATPLAAGAEYYVEIPSGAIVDQAPVPNAFSGISGTAAWNFTLAATTVLPTVVVNKYFNGTPDRVELLVVGNGTAGSAVDLRGMILKDFSSDMSGDVDGKLLFAANPLWAAVPAGTLITLSNTGSSPDLASGDFTLGVGLKDGTYFNPAPASGEFDINPTDLVMIKAAGSDPAGTDGGIHALGAGPADALSYFASFPGAKVRATVTAGTQLGVKANNATGTLADFTSGTDATGGLALGLADFGIPNGATNAAYIASLRGLAAGSGDGLATVTNATLASPFLGLPMFDDGQTGQSAKVTLLAQVGGVTLANASITIPAALGTPVGVILSGPGAAGASVSVIGQTVTVSGAAATTTNALEITISGLSTPVPALAHESGNYPLAVATAASGGTLTPIPGQPPLHVIIPIQSLRDVDADGVSLDSGVVVAIEGTATEADFGGGAANFSGFVQDATAGINVFASTLNLGLVRGHRYAVLGTVAQINGQTAVVPSAGSNLVALGAVPEVVPQTVTLATLFANPEAYEGKLVTVKNLMLESGTWGPGASVTLKDAVPTNIDVRIQPGSTASSPPLFPSSVTGVFGQSDGTLPLNAGYQLMPRDADDLGSDFDNWLGMTGGPTGGATGDPDFDGRDNAFEYAFGLNPTSGGESDPFVTPLDRTTGKLAFTRRTQSLTGLEFKVFTSTTLSGWTEDPGASLNVIGTAGDRQTVEVTLSAPKPLAAPKLFVRVEAE